MRRTLIVCRLQTTWMVLWAAAQKSCWRSCTIRVWTNGPSLRRPWAWLCNCVYLDRDARRWSWFCQKTCSKDSMRNRNMPDKPFSSLLRKVVSKGHRRGVVRITTMWVAGLFWLHLKKTRIAHCKSAVITTKKANRYYHSVVQSLFPKRFKWQQQLKS